VLANQLPPGLTPTRRLTSRLRRRRIGSSSTSQLFGLAINGINWVAAANIVKPFQKQNNNFKNTTTIDSARKAD
jgi:hypothetical protein